VQLNASIREARSSRVGIFGANEVNAHATPAVVINVVFGYGHTILTRSLRSGSVNHDGLLSGGWFYGFPIKGIARNRLAYVQGYVPWNFDWH
jgi:hypothetical protein